MEKTYEQSIKRLEEIVALLDKSDISLDESIKLYEEGAKLSKFCAEKLNSAKQKISVISGDDNND